MSISVAAALDKLVPWLPVNSIRLLAADEV